MAAMVYLNIGQMYFTICKFFSILETTTSVILISLGQYLKLLKWALKRKGTPVSLCRAVVLGSVGFNLVYQST